MAHASRSFRSLCAAVVFAGCSSSPEGAAVPAEAPSPSVAADAAAATVAQTPLPQAARRGRSNRRSHEANATKPLQLQPATESVPYTARADIRVEGSYRVIRANGAPAHRVGKFPNRGNPHAIEEQSYEVRVPAAPTIASMITPLGNHNFGFAVNGVPFDPGAAEFYLGDRDSWQYEALGGAVPLGIDDNHAHVQPTGAYHYHGLPKGLLAELGVGSSAVSPIVGWAADGFPIYALYGPSNPKDASSAPKEYRSSHALRRGERPSSEGHPGGSFDGTFVADYQFVEGSGDLDTCNGATVVTEDFPDGTYAYFLTRDWPVIPRCYRGTPEPSVVERGPGGPPPGSGHDHPPHRGRGRRGGR